MGKPVNAQGSECQFWHSGDKSECLLTRGGIYIPLPDHIRMFCLTESYYKCPQYIRCHMLVEETAPSCLTRYENSRRKYRRVKNKLSLLLASCNEKKEIGEILDREAHTIDIGLGGFQVNCGHNLSLDKTIAFTFGDDFSFPSYTAIGKIKWSQSAGERFRAGIEFMDSATIQTVGNHLKHNLYM